jgi:hypothetical protein
MSSKKAMPLFSPSRERLASDVVVSGEEYSFGPSLRPLERLFIVIDDAELETLAKVFAMSPVSQAMTFEAYLAVKGFARRSDDEPAGGASHE